MKLKSDDIVLYEGDNPLNIQLTPIGVPGVAFSLFLRNAPVPVAAGYYNKWEVFIDGQRFNGEYTHHPLNITCPPATTLRILVHDEEVADPVFDRTVSAIFEDGALYAFDCSSYKLEKVGEIPRLVSLVLPPSVNSGAFFNIESTWFLPNPWGGITPVYAFEIWINIPAPPHPIYPQFQYWYSRRLQIAHEIASPSHGLHTFRNFEALKGAEPGRRPQASWEYHYVPGTSIKTWVNIPMDPGSYPIEAEIGVSKWINGYTFPQAGYDQGIVGYLKVV